LPQAKLGWDVSDKLLGKTKGYLEEIHQITVLSEIGQDWNPAIPQRVSVMHVTLCGAHIIQNGDSLGLV